MPLTKFCERRSIRKVAFVASAAVYFDPRVAFLMIPITIAGAGLKNNLGNMHFFGIAVHGTARRLFIVYAAVLGVTYIPVITT